MKKYMLSTAVAAVAMAGADGLRRRARPDPDRGFVHGVPVHDRCRREARPGRQVQDPGRRIDRHRRRHEAVLRRRRRDHADFTNASRAIKDSELETCKANGVTPVEIKVGFDGIVLANSKAGAVADLTKEQIFKALAKNVAVDGKVVANPYVNWADIDASLPATKIEVLGPPPTSGTRDAFVELVMDAACQEEVKAANEKGCGEIREDGAYVEAGENDNLIVQKLEANPTAFGIFGFSFLDQNADKLQGHKIDGVEPTFENIADGKYGVSRSLYIYAKKEHVGVIPGMEEFIAEYTSDAAWGPDGYLADKGLIPLPDAERAKQAEDAKALKGMGS